MVNRLLQILLIRTCNRHLEQDGTNRDIGSLFLLEDMSLFGLWYKFLNWLVYRYVQINFHAASTALHMAGGDLV
jgi:hypothetical protein